MGGTLRKQTEVGSLSLSNLRVLPDLTSDSVSAEHTCVYPCTGVLYRVTHLGLPFFFYNNRAVAVIIYCTD